MNVIPSPAANAATIPLVSSDRAGQILEAAIALAPLLERGAVIGATDLRTVMTNAFGGSDAAGFWTWKDAYEATEAAQVLFLRKFGAAITAHAAQGALAMLAKVAALVPTHTRRSEESQALQQLSTPMPLAYVATRAAGIMADDVVLEPSAGTGCWPSSASSPMRACASTNMPRCAIRFWDSSSPERR